MPKKATLQVNRKGKLEKVVRAGYGEQMFTDCSELAYSASKDCFGGYVWDGNFGPDDNTCWFEVPFAAVVKQFGEQVAEQLKAG